ncbi:DUF3352 domain-containing protein [cf. Phormidesmis sp. LEGE 11477]|uniref:DUF3352 domain-containing protein n=1 Tax=cf. Phormidesmis sp. LEGE 11477 TaxID=1828680 RepID=UPI00187FF256|nr:DUF3352 domain-containing protein [cf. Phormidesmis sp. LEGE 11477]MBE9062754.1 DUF3352 domain-containing protein [cf. Phormidesmis sp. LEGE 11477]
MVTATETSASGRSGRGFWSERFYVVMLTLSSILLLCGAAGFLYLESNSPLSLLGGSDRPIAAATLFVPRQSAFSASLLTRPEKIAAFLQSLESPDQRQRSLQEIEQLKQQFLDKVGLDYEQTIQPWLGEEVTFARTFTDLDLDSSNGQQPGYLVAAEIAPSRQHQAQAFLQLFWQQQALSGNVPSSEKLSGVRILSSTSVRSPAIKATALVGDQFVLLANDARVLKRSIQVAQTAENLAQNSAYRKTVAALPETRIGLAYFDLNLFDLNLLDDARSDRVFAAMSIGLDRTGLVAEALPSSAASRVPAQVDRSAPANERGQTPATLSLLPANSEVAIADQTLSRLRSDLAAIGLSADALPALLQSVLQLEADSTPSTLENWATGDYALGRVNTGRSHDWVLVVERDEAGIAALDRYAIASGYSKVPISVGEATVTAWTRLKAVQNGQRGRDLETELLGLHLQRDRYEIFADSLAAMNSVLAASEPLVQSARFEQVIGPLATSPERGYIYLDWPAVAPALSRRFPALAQAVTVTAPAFSHIDTVAATRADEAVSLFVRLKGSA